MTYIPNARTGENGYKDTDLKGEAKAYLAGYDQAVEDILNFEHNLDVFSGDSLVIHYLEENPNKAAELFKYIKDWAEMDRNETAVSLLDEQSSEENNDI